MLSKTFKIATRRSPLALWQAEYVQQQLIAAHPGLRVELVPMVTKGDIILDTPCLKWGKGLFVKELEQALLEQRADMAVHSMKDVPVDFPPGLGLVSICQRDDPHDAFVSGRYASLDELPQGAIVGTSSLRRECQIRTRRPDLSIRPLRGNLGTRLAKLDAGEYDAIILAVAGLKRLNLTSRIRSILPAAISLPAVGQGAVGVECRLDDSVLIDLLRALNHDDTAVCVSAERAMNARLEGGCQVPIGSFAQLQNDEIWLRGPVGSPDGVNMVRGERRGPRAQAISMGISLAEELLDNGAREILHAVYQGKPSGMTILVTRPDPAASGLTARLRALGREAWSMPLLEFTPGNGLDQLAHHLIMLHEGDLVFALSQQAIHYAQPRMQQHGAAWPPQPDYYAIGRSTALALHKACGHYVEYPYEDETSETLIQLNTLQQVKGKRVLILCGNNGRDLLARTLAARGANVQRCECYQRCYRHYDGAIEGKRWRDRGINTLVVTSGEMLQHLYSLFPTVDREEWLLRCRLLVVSERLATLATRLGWRDISVADGADNDALLRALLNA